MRCGRQVCSEQARPDISCRIGWCALLCTQRFSCGRTQATVGAYHLCSKSQQLRQWLGLEWDARRPAGISALGTHPVGAKGGLLLGVSILAGK